MRKPRVCNRQCLHLGSASTDTVTLGKITSLHSHLGASLSYSSVYIKKQSTCIAPYHNIITVTVISTT
jgi:hypothetical protein